ncbi:ParB/RepB/Spo0J family partition protein [Jiella sonneratiae]|uniref:ParB/RepB/Spo0J family partition protein n=1 Tax=Jiella sonneratiae TaxID=2816856 RepID=A0ABS3JBE7_9HYPH|nr:ParB/RepB/Spo0J family partition protein [Jiella sonneratiae]MBO0906293.1 ParB/RepB/Spo0J family partition protein [Jiella sonneratiae]
MTTLETTLPLNCLIAGKANVRRTARMEGIDALAASIAAHGLQQNLVVRPAEDGSRHEVVAGNRRLAALKRLAKQKRIARNAPIPCKVLNEDDDATEISLAENAMRADMHPDDQCEAFRTLIDEHGMGIEAVAARFGVTPAVVQRRLKIAHVSPKLRALYRKGTLSLEQMMAFALVDDHRAQEDVWTSLPTWSRHPRDIRAALTAETLPATHRLALFVGIEDYVAAGGAVIRDLFDEANDGYLTDRALLMRLADAKLAEAVTAVEAEGWKWVKAEPEPDYTVHYDHLPALPIDEDADTGEEDDEAEERYAPEDVARAGVVLRIGHDGGLVVRRGLVHPHDREPEAADGNAPAKAKRKLQPGELPARLVEELTAHRTAALRLELASHPLTALAATVEALALSLLYAPWEAATSSLALKASSEDLARHTEATGDCDAHRQFAQMREYWGDRLPGDPRDLFAWCLGQTQEVLLDLLAFLAGLSVNAVQAKHDWQDSPRLIHADRLAATLSLNMAEHYTPSVDGFYGKLTKATLIAITAEAKAPIAVRLSELKKEEAARRTHKAMQACPGWLPAPLRSPRSEAAAQAA